MKLSLISLIVTITGVAGHGRWLCPAARDEKDEKGEHIAFDNTGNKYAACGPMSMQWGFGQTTTLQPGWVTLSWEESISHSGSPFRISILDENEVSRIVLLDHIPHNEDSSPTAYVEKTYTPYKVSVKIPDVNCEKCSLQLLYVMTDKTTKCGVNSCYYNPLDAACKGSTDPSAATCAGAPNSNVCVEENECFSNYHSCTDVTINGSRPIEEFSYDGQLDIWPFGSSVKKMQFYSQETGAWKNGWLVDVPSNFTTDYKVPSC